MKNIKDINLKNLKTGEKIYRLSQGNIEYYTFLTIHPENERYIILLDSCKIPKRFFINPYDDSLIDFYIDCTEKDLLEYKKIYYQEKLSEIELELEKLNPKNLVN